MSEARFQARTAFAVVSRRAPAVLDVWIADYSTPDPAAPLLPGKPSAPKGHARVRVELLAAPGKRVEGSGSYSAAATTQPGAGRATLVVETAGNQHGAYSGITGQATVTTYDAHQLCGTFRIGDAATSASGVFSATF